MFLVGSDPRKLTCAANMMQSFRRPLLDLWHFPFASDAQWQVCARLGKHIQIDLHAQWEISGELYMV